MSTPEQPSAQPADVVCEAAMHVSFTLSSVCLAAQLNGNFNVTAHGERVAPGHCQKLGHCALAQSS